VLRHAHAILAFMVVDCRSCHKEIGYTKSIEGHKRPLSYLYDIPMLSGMAKAVNDDWVGVIYSDEIYCRLCISSKRVVFGTINSLFQ